VGVCCMCVILMQITFPVFELQLVDTCVRVCAVMLVYICIYVCVHVFVCAYFACRHTFSTKYYTILLKKSTTDRPGQRAHKCSPFSLSLSLYVCRISPHLYLALSQLLSAYLCPVMTYLLLASEFV